jgi:hypothetical protein
MIMGVHCEIQLVMYFTPKELRKLFSKAVHGSKCVAICCSCGMA